MKDKEKLDAQKEPQEEICEEEKAQEEEPLCEEQEKECEVSIEQLQEEIEKLKDENLREHADFENIKKRLEKEKYQAISYAHEGFARDLLPIVDALENALLSSSEDEENEVIKKYKEGIELTLEQFKKCFDKHDIKAVSCEGEFDPNVHEALMKVESETVKSGHIVQTLQKGYTIKERVLRPAMVSIAK